MRLEGLDQLKNPMTSSGIEPPTFRLVPQCLNQLRYCVPRWTLVGPSFSLIFIFSISGHLIKRRSRNPCIFLCFPEPASVTVTLYPCIQEVLGWNLGHDTQCLDWGFPWFSWDSPGECWDSSTIKAPQLHSKFSPISLPSHHSVL
jgi:hypothetical protein